jgi:hypothetical protein
MYYPELEALYNLNEYPDPDLAKDKKSKWNLIGNPHPDIGEPGIP